MKVERMGILGLCVSALILILLVLSSICGAESRRMLTDSNGRRYLEKNSDDPGNQALNIPAPRAIVYESDDGNEIDPRYGVEKRLVPTGPNPLHHWTWPWSIEVQSSWPGLYISSDQSSKIWASVWIQEYWFLNMGLLVMINIELFVTGRICMFLRHPGTLMATIESQAQKLEG